MEEISSYRARPSAVWLARITGYLFVLVMFGCLVGASYAPTAGSFALAASGVVTAGILAAPRLRFGHSMGGRPIEMSKHGVRLAGEVGWTPWNSITGLRDAPLSQRVELLSAIGVVEIPLAYTLERVEEAATAVIESVRSDDARLAAAATEQSWSSPLLTTDRTILAGICAVSVALYTVLIPDSPWLGLAVAVILLRSPVHRELVRLTSLTISNEGLRLDYGPFRVGQRRRNLPWTKIENFRLVLGHDELMRRFDVWVQVGDESFSVRPAGTDPFEVFAALRVRRDAPAPRHGPSA